MTIEEIKEKRRILSRDIKELIDEFERSTGVEVKDINLEKIESYTVEKAIIINVVGVELKI